MTPADYLKQHPQPTSVTLAHIEQVIGQRMAVDALKKIKQAEVERRLRKDMTQAEASAALGVKPKSLPSTMRGVFGVTFAQWSGKTRAPSEPVRREKPGDGFDVTKCSFYASRRPTSITAIANETRYARPYVRRILREAMIDGLVEEVHPDVYQRAVDLTPYKRMPWAGGEAARLIAVERERALEEWAAA